jgi:general secretion pathway protein L
MVSRALSVSLARSRITDLLARLGKWWLDEFLALFPGRFAEWLTDRGYKKLTLRVEPDGVVLQLLTDRRRPLASVRIAHSVYTPAAIDDFLKAQNLDRGDVVIGMQLPGDHFFSRQLTLPVEAAGSIDEIVAQDLVAKTPFRLADIYHGYQSRREDGKVQVSQWIVRREFVARAVHAAGLNLDDLTFVESSEDGGSDDAPLPTLALQHQTERQPWLKKTFYALALGVLVLAVSACAHKYWRQQRVLDAIGADLPAAKAKAQEVRAAMSRLEQKQAAIAQLRAQKRDVPGLLDVWEEVSKILPANSWLTELRLTENAQKQDRIVVMTGLSTDAAGLVPLLDRSPLFVDAALAAPIALDAREQRERFTLQAKLAHNRPNAAP